MAHLTGAGSAHYSVHHRWGAGAATVIHLAISFSNLKSWKFIVTVTEAVTVTVTVTVTVLLRTTLQKRLQLQRCLLSVDVEVSAIAR